MTSKKDDLDKKTDLELMAETLSSDEFMNEFLNPIDEDYSMFSSDPFIANNSILFSDKNVYNNPAIALANSDRGFRVSPNVLSYVEHMRIREIKPKVEEGLENISEEEREYLKNHAAELLEVNDDDRDSLFRKTEEIREEIKVFLRETIAPISIGYQMATDEFDQELEIIFGSSNVKVDTTYLNKMFQDAVILSFYQFLSKKLDLSPEHSELLAESYIGAKFSAIDKRRQARGQSSQLGEIQDMVSKMATSSSRKDMSAPSQSRRR